LSLAETGLKDCIPTACLSLQVKKFFDDNLQVTKNDSLQALMNMVMKFQFNKM
jgi:hypothetical protein